MSANSPSNTPRRAGRHFLHIPGPTPVPDRILRAIDMPIIDHRGPEFGKLGLVSIDIDREAARRRFRGTVALLDEESATPPAA